MGVSQKTLGSPWSDEDRHALGSYQLVQRQIGRRYSAPCILCVYCSVEGAPVDARGKGASNHPFYVDPQRPAVNV